MSNPSIPGLNKRSDGRDRILDVAELLFQDRGYAAVSMRDIAEATGVRQASLYYHFPSKEQLFVSVRERGFERHRVGLQNAFERADKELRSQLQAAADWFLSQPPIKFLGMMQSDMPSLSQEAEQHLARVSFQSTVEPIVQIFIVAQANGKIRNVQPRLLTGFFLSVLESIPFVYKPGKTATKEEMTREMISVLLEGIEID
jgi:TetR/AcrR family transcriptional regulator, cholesterol catabolism regulator